jgi:hypothetical protein
VRLVAVRTGLGNPRVGEEGGLEIAPFIKLTGVPEIALPGPATAAEPGQKDEREGPDSTPKPG